MQLGFENKKKMMWAAGLGAVAVLIFAYEFIPMFTEPTTSASSAQAAAPSPLLARTPTGKAGKVKGGKQPKVENLDPTLRLDLLAASEQTRYEGSGRNIFVSQAEEIPRPMGPGHTDVQKPVEPQYQVPTPPPAQPIPLKFYGFASSPGEPKKIFLKLNDDVFVAGEGEIVDRRYKVIRITNTYVEIQDVVNSGPPQNIPLTQG
ncbi:MAG TPA: hypothetical protein VMB66_05750 [Candidatus Acidoferrales bacterium]|nr:hypothetical protein [Candidatus Acidoferrales bacterium]